MRINLMGQGGGLAHTRQEHGPAHVHVHKDGGVARIWLGDANMPPWLRDYTGMRAVDAAAALRIVDDHQAMLLAEWRRLNG